MSHDPPPRTAVRCTLLAECSITLSHTDPTPLFLAHGLSGTSRSKVRKTRVHTQQSSLDSRSDHLRDRLVMRAYSVPHLFHQDVDDLPLLKLELRWRLVRADPAAIEEEADTAHRNTLTIAEGCHQFLHHRFKR